MNYLHYEELKRKWVAKHPNATSQEYHIAMIAIAWKLGI